MSDPTENDEDESDSVPEVFPPADERKLILKGLAIICCAFVSAYIILFLHEPMGH